MASMVTMHPCSSSIGSNWGIAVISLDFSAVRAWPSVSVLAEAQALTRACPVPRYGVDGPLARIAVVGTPHRLAVDGHHFPGDQVGHRLDPGREALLELLRVQPGEDVAEEPAPAKAGVSWEGMPLGSSKESAEPLLAVARCGIDFNPLVVLHFQNN